MTAKRIIQYGDKKIDMPDGVTLDEAKTMMARFFPELAEPKIENKKDGDTTVYVFTKQAGKKGAHTTGPWIVRRDEDDKKLRVIAKGDFAGLDVCIVQPWETHDQDNAALIAAAPDLLEALKQASEDVCSLGCSPVWKTGDKQSHSDKCKKIKSVIAKAEAQVVA